MFGYDRPEDIIGKPINVTVHPDDIAMVTEINHAEAEASPTCPRYEFKGITRDGKIIYIEVSATNITYRGVPVSLVYLRDVTERKRAEEALRQSHLELERLNRAKTKAVNHISHELKTPLAVIQGNIRILKRKLEDTPSRGRACTTLRSSNGISKGFSASQSRRTRFFRCPRNWRQESSWATLTACGKGWKTFRRYLRTLRPTGPT